MNVTPGQQVGGLAGLRLRDRRPGPWRPWPRRAGRMSRPRASRMSSVLGLKVRPSTPTVLPARSSLPSTATTLPAMAFLRSSLTATVVSISRIGRAGVLRGGAHQGEGVLGEARAAVAGTGDAGTWRPMRLSRPMPRATSCTSAPTFSHRSAISLMKVIFIARKALAAYLISSAGAPAGEHDRRLVQDQRPVELAHHRLGASLVVRADHHPVGVLEVLDRARLRAGTRVGHHRELGVGAGLRG